MNKRENQIKQIMDRSTSIHDFYYLFIRPTLSSSYSSSFLVIRPPSLLCNILILRFRFFLFFFSDQFFFLFLFFGIHLIRSSLPKLYSYSLSWTTIIPSAKPSF